MSSYPNLSKKIFNVVKAHLPSSSPEFDPSTLSNYNNFSIKNTTLDVQVFFKERKLVGSISFEIETLFDTANIVLDSSYLNIFDVFVNGEKKPFEIKERQEPLGAPFLIKHASTAKDVFTLKIDYETTAECTALQWLDPQQTDGHKLPYLFSQCEPIHARSFFPCFDTPSIKSKFTYHVTSPLNVLTSGLLSDKKDVGNGQTLYHFEQPVPIPSYLVSIASGDVVGAEIGPRSQVYSEPSFIDRCQYEFKNDTENFIQAAESIVFDYEWQDYDVLVLPPSMPFGGMEHPNCTFATPTLISGDRENVDVIAHELAHSWSGNLVTNCSFEHFWLNEGWTVYLERRIQGKIHGEKFRQFSAIIGWNDLENSIKSMGSSASRFSTLVQNLKDGCDPDDSFSTVPYEKGFNLLYHIEQTLGGTSEFDPFIKYYFNKYKYKSLDTYEFLDTLYGFYSEKKDILDTIDWQTWLYVAGMPPKPKFDTELVDECYTLASKWIKLIKESPESLASEFKSSDISNFGANQNGVFLDTLVSYEGKDGFTWTSDNGRKAIETMSKVYNKYSESQNAEVVFRWFRLLLTGKISDSYSKLAEWVGTVGRMKFVRPSFSMLNKVDRPLALETFAKFENSYHPICKAMVKKDLGLS
ncbi:bifunctional aminopeptidase/epoxide hydrolase [Martiniozyma asiatica (nom. inval.)]|nr:bifunctional aminopeptidase/epoxide hydrolase [Martiniozyma asiatica]